MQRLRWISDGVSAWLDENIGKLVTNLRFLVAPAQSWIIVSIAVTFLAVGYTLLSSIAQQLASMNFDGSEGFTLERFFGRSQLDRAVPAWKEAWQRFNNTIAETTGDPYVSPLHLAKVSLLLDYIFFMPGYLVGGLAIALKGYRKTTSVHLKPFLRWMVVLLFAVFLLDAVENGFTWRLVETYWEDPSAPRSWADGVVSIVTTVKWLLAIPILITLMILGVTRAREAPNSRVALRMFRPQIVVGVVTFILLALPIQVADLLIRARWSQALAMAAAAVALSIALFASARLVADALRADNPEIRAPGWRLLLALSAVPLALATLNALTGGNWKVPLIPLAIAGVVLLVGFPLRGIAPAAHPVTRDAGRAAFTVPQTLAGIVLVAAGLAALRVMMIPYIQGGDIHPVLLTLGIGLIVSGVVAPIGFYFLERSLSRDVHESGLDALVSDDSDADRRRRRGVYGAALGTVSSAILAVVAWIIANPGNAQLVGAVAIVLIFMTAVAIVVSALVFAADWWTDSFGVPIALRAMGIRTIPIFTILFLWGVAAAAFDDGAHWEVRSLRADPPHGVTLEAAFESWHARSATESDEDDAIPLVIVATSGGGIRSAYWTALTLDCLFLGRKAETATHVVKDPCRGTGEAEATESLFVASGISGGSLGLIAWDANPKEEAGGTWVEDRLGADFVAPSIAQGLFIEVPRSFLHFAAPGRAEALERAWEATWEEGGRGALTEGFLESQEVRVEQGGPFLILNGASVLDGCALNISLLDIGSSVDQYRSGANAALRDGDCTSISRYTKADSGQDSPGALPATLDIVDYLGCREATDIRRSTAALLSARFPYVSSAAQLRGCANGAATKFVVDGGYVDTSASETAFAIWLALESLLEERRTAGIDDRCFVPYYVQIDNAYSPTLSPGRQPDPPNQLVAPVTALINTTGLQSRGARARAMSALTFSKAWNSTGPSDRYALITPRTHPGVQAPLGWTLSEESQRDLETQLYVANSGAIEKVRHWLDTTLPCPN